MEKGKLVKVEVTMQEIWQATRTNIIPTKKKYNRKKEKINIKNNLEK